MIDKLKLRWRSCIRIIVVVAVAVPGILASLNIMATRPENLGVHGGRLAACPTTSNCVCSQANDAAHHIGSLQIPVEHLDSRELYMDQLATAVEATPGNAIIQLSDNYIHAECTSAIFRFVDDLELYVDWHRRELHFRSASRIGYADLGVNRRRVERIRQRLVISGLAREGK